jgi:hypothetical protein
MAKLLRPLKELRQHYSQQINRGRELVARGVARSQELSHLLADAERWDRENALLLQNTFVGTTPEYQPLPPVATHGNIDSDLHALHADITANLRRLEAVEAQLIATKTGCLGLLLFALPLLAGLGLAAQLAAAR